MVATASQNETSSDIPSLNAIAAGTRASTNNVLTGILAALETAMDEGGEDGGSDAGDPARPDESSAWRAAAPDGTAQRIAVPVNPRSVKYGKDRSRMPVENASVHGAPVITRNCQSAAKKNGTKRPTQPGKPISPTRRTETPANENANNTNASGLNAVAATSSTTPHAPPML